MSWKETWLDTAFAPAANTCLAAAAQAGAQGMNFYLGGRFSAGRGWTASLAREILQAGLTPFGTWVSLQPGQGGYAIGYQDGLDALAVASTYPVQWITYDVEPVTWHANPAGVTAAMNGFADAVHQRSKLLVLQYGLPATLESGITADAVWAAVPGQPDPALAVTGFPDRRAVQFTQANLAGVTWDFSHSEFSLAGDAVNTPVENCMRFVIWNNLQQLFRLKPDGTLVQAWTTGTGRWLQAALGVGYVVGTLTVDATSVPNQLHVFAQNGDGSVAHFWQVANTADWKMETIPTA